MYHNHTDNETKKQIERAKEEYSHWQILADEKTKVFMREAQEQAENMIKIFNEITDIKLGYSGGFIYSNYSIIIIPHFLDKTEIKKYLDIDNIKEYIIIRYPYSNPDLELIKKAILSYLPIIWKTKLNKSFIHACNLQLSYIIADTVSFYHPEFHGLLHREFRSYLLTILSAVFNNYLISRLYPDGAVNEYRDCSLEELENYYKKDIQLLNESLQFDYAHRELLRDLNIKYYWKENKMPLSNDGSRLISKQRGNHFYYKYYTNTDNLVRTKINSGKVVEGLSEDEIEKLLNFFYNNDYNGKALDFSRHLQEIAKNYKEYEKISFSKYMNETDIIIDLSEKIRSAFIDEKCILKDGINLTIDEKEVKKKWKHDFLRDRFNSDGLQKAEDIIEHFANGFNNAAQNANFKDIRLAFEEMFGDFYTYLEEGSNIYNFLKSISCNQLNFSHVFRFYALFIAHGEGVMEDIINGLIQDIETHYQHIQSDAMQKGLNNLKNGNNPGIGFIYELTKQAPNEEMKNITNLILFLLEKKEIYKRMKSEGDTFNFSQELENAREYLEYYNKFEQKNSRRLVYKKDE